MNSKVIGLSFAVALVLTVGLVYVFTRPDSEDSKNAKIDTKQSVSTSEQAKALPLQM